MNPMHHIDIYEESQALKEHSIFVRLSERFNNLFVHNQTTSAILPNSCYIYNSLDFFPSVLVYPKRIELTDVDMSTSTSAQRTLMNSYNAPIMFMKGEYKIGGYLPEENVLFLCDITHTFNQFTVGVLTNILNWLDVNCVEFQSIDSIDVKKTITMNIGKLTYSLKPIGLCANYRQDFINEVQNKAKDTIIKLRKNWEYHLSRESQRYENLRKSTKVMPDVTPPEVIKHKLMLSKQDNYIVWSFKVNVVCNEVYDENSNKYCKLPENKTYDGILSLYVNESNRIDNVFFMNEDSTPTGHLHTNHHTLCVGTTNLKATPIKDKFDLFSRKDKLLETMKMINVGSCHGDSDKALLVQCRKLLEEVKENTMKTWTVHT